MSKLSHSFNKTDDNQQENTNNNGNSFTLSQKVQKQTTEVSENTTEFGKISTSIATEKKQEVIHSVTSVEDISTWLLSFIGESVFEQLKNNPYLQLPYVEPNITLKEWLEKALKTIFSMEQIQNIGTQIQVNQIKTNNLIDSSQQTVDLTEKYNKAQQKFQQMQEQFDDIEGEKVKLKKELASSLPLSKLISGIFKEDIETNEEVKKIVRLLNESLQNFDENLSTFVMQFGRGWAYLQGTFAQLSQDEKENLEKIYAATTKFLTYITELYIPERRPLLDCIAKICSQKLQTYDFVSPEQTLQVDPSIHNAQGVGNARIKEGVTFAVVRRESKQAVKYAEIKVI